MPMSQLREKFYLAFGLWFHFWLIPITILGGLAAIGASFLDRTGKLTQRAARGWARALVWTGRISVEVKGMDHLVPGQNYIFAANHRSNFDIYVLLAQLPGTFAFIAKKSLFRIPLFGQAIHRLGCVPVDRENIQQAILDAAAKTVPYQRKIWADYIDDAVARLEAAELPRDEQRPLERRLNSLRDYAGFTCDLELSFDHQGRVYCFSLRTEWYEDLLDILDEIDASYPEQEEEDGEGPLGGYFSRN